MKEGFIRGVLTYIRIALGAVIYSFAISGFLDPNSLAPGGVTGLAMIVNRLTDIETGTLILLINIPILLLGLRKFGIKFVASTIYCIFLVSVFTNIFSINGAVTYDPVLACVAGSALMALGIGVVFKAKGTTGGTDIIVKILRLKFPHMKTSGLFLILDASVVFCSYLVFRDIEKTLYAGICVFLTSQVLDFVLYGPDEAKLIYIISDRHKQIADRLLKELDLGVTYMEGAGAYSGKEKKIIMCAVRKSLAYKTEEVVKEEDSMAFMIITSATEIYGKGYKSYFGERM